MVKWFINKDNKIPIYIQIRDLIRYYISTGTLKNNDKLPSLIDLADKLSINFETVRNAYKNLEKEGLIILKRGKGTFVSKNSYIEKNKSYTNIYMQDDKTKKIEQFIKDLLREGHSLEYIKKEFSKVISQLTDHLKLCYLIFTECNEYQTRELSVTISKELKMKVLPVVLNDLERHLEDKIIENNKFFLGIVTTGFHINEVKDIIHNKKIPIYIIVTNMSNETRTKIQSHIKKKKFSFICRDKESIPFFIELFHVDFDLEFSYSYIFDDIDLKKLNKDQDVLIVSPPIFENIKKLVPENLPVYNIFDQIDPASLMTLKNLIK